VDGDYSWLYLKHLTTLRRKLLTKPIINISKTKNRKRRPTPRRIRPGSGLTDPESESQSGLRMWSSKM